MILSNYPDIIHSKRQYRNFQCAILPFCYVDKSWLLLFLQYYVLYGWCVYYLLWTDYRNSVAAEHVQENYWNWFAFLYKPLESWKRWWSVMLIRKDKSCLCCFVNVVGGPGVTVTQQWHGNNDPHNFKRGLSMCKSGTDSVCHVWTMDFWKHWFIIIIILKKLS
jgi:hypothetical protein